MKRFLTALLATAMSIALVLSGCGEKEDDIQPVSEAPEDVIVETKATVDEPMLQPEDVEVNLMQIHGISKNRTNDFAGSWTITEGEGAKYKNFVYMFNGEDRCYLMIGSVGQYANYTVDAENSKITAMMMFGINGTYTYEFSEDKQTVTLTDDKGEKTVLTRLAVYEYIPMPLADAETDEKLLGAWKGENGDYLYFTDNGVMYQNSLNISFYFSNYSADGKKVHSSYAYKENKTVEQDQEYSFSGETLVFDGEKYEKIKPSELI